MMNSKESEKNIFDAELATSIKILYWSTLIFVIILLIVVSFITEMSFLEKIIFYSIFIFVLILFIYILYKAHNMKYILESEKLIIYGAMGSKTVNIEDIKNIEKTVIPFGFRMFGASFLGGWYYLPGVGKAWVAMGNFRDGVLITTKDKLNIVVTPKNPSKFIDIIERNQKK